MADGLIIAAPRTGSGKTLVTLGLIAALRARGLAVAPAKTGPDYIDAAILSRTAGRAAINLDAWAMAPARLAALAAAQAAAADLLVVEGVMGLFDGAADGTGSTGDLAAALGLPVLLVVDAERQGQSVAALVAGFAGWRAEVRIGGVILNRVSTTRHEKMLVAALGETSVPVLGALPKRDGLVLPERHLGLVLPAEVTGFDAVVAAAGAAVAAYVDLEAVLGVAAAPSSGATRHLLPRGEKGSEGEAPLTRPYRATLSPTGRGIRTAVPQDSSPRRGEVPAGGEGELPPFPSPLVGEGGVQHRMSGPSLPPLGQRIAIARDDAFAFLYEHWLRDWRSAGADLIFFSPLADEAPAADADAIFLPGGYPELHGARLATAANFKAGLVAAARRGALLYGECGGYMVLGEGLTDRDGVRHEMAGLLPLETSIGNPKRTLGYRRLGHASPLPWPALLSGHEFHYSSGTAPGLPPLFAAADATGAVLPPLGAQLGKVMGSYAHVIDAG